MSSTPWLFTNSLDSTAATAQFLKAHREKIAFEADERAQQRRAQLTEQSSSLHTPEREFASGKRFTACAFRRIRHTRSSTSLLPIRA